MFRGVIDPDYQGEIGVLLHKDLKDDSVWNAGNPLGRLLMPPCPVIIVSGKLQHPSPGRVTVAQTLEGLKYGSFLQEKSQDPPRVEEIKNG